MKNVVLLAVALVALGLVGPAAGDMEIGGMLSMSPVLEESYAAIWVPVPPDHAVAGIRWYNNDETTVFPKVLVASGEAELIVGLEDAIEVAINVQGVSLGWSAVTFDQPYACLHEGLYCLFVFPEGREYVSPGIGGGAAIGYTTGEGAH